MNSRSGSRRWRVSTRVPTSIWATTRNSRARRSSISILETGESYVPYVIETSIGVDRMVLQVLSASYEEQKLENGETRVVMHFPPALAPVKAAVLPLVKKDGLPEVAREILHQLKFDFNMQYDEKDSIGKRYRRQDAIGNAVLYYGGSPNLGGSDRNRPVSRFNGTETCSYLPNSPR